MVAVFVLVVVLAVVRVVVIVVVVVVVLFLFVAPSICRPVPEVVCCFVFFPLGIFTWVLFLLLLFLLVVVPLLLVFSPILCSLPLLEAVEVQLT